MVVVFVSEQGICLPADACRGHSWHPQQLLCSSADVVVDLLHCDLLLCSSLLSRQCLCCVHLLLRNASSIDLVSGSCNSSCKCLRAQGWDEDGHMSSEMYAPGRSQALSNDCAAAGQRCWRDVVGGGLLLIKWALKGTGTQSRHIGLGATERIAAACSYNTVTSVQASFSCAVSKATLKTV